MAKKATSRQPGPDRVLDAALKLASGMRWRDISMEMIAEESGASLGRVYELFPSRMALLNAFIRRTDKAVLAGHDFGDASEPVRERLLDVIMRRLDALATYKDAVASITRDLGRDPGALLCAGPAFMNSMAWSLEAAGVSASGLPGIVRTKGLAAIYLSAIRVWLRDDTQDQSETMAYIDKNLKRAESAMSMMPFRRGWRGKPEVSEG
ncbi:MAG: TetR family transcriptional regulator [Rhodospirillaceae bacterium]|nr:TetR family transcriptional regulator [Rhodospirillaceae bacterium]